MRTAVLSLLCLLLALTSCKKDHADPVSDGDYTGTFRRISLTGTGAASNVTLHLRGGSYSGSSDNARYPAICVGGWEASEGQLHFWDGCVFTADFDWTLILEGDFDYSISGSHLKFWKTAGDHTDVYDLKKK